jgi:hypothetical protein
LIRLRRPLDAILASIAFAASAALAGCGGAPGGLGPGRMFATDSVVGLPPPIFGDVSQPTAPTSPPLPPIGDACSGSGRICLALKYVSYLRPGDSSPVADREDAIRDVRAINSLWSQCGLSFQIESYQEARPESHGLNFGTRDMAELERIRKVFADRAQLLVVMTGEWDRTGSLGNSSANAWTTLPGSVAHGAVVEEPVVGFSNLLAHELGHYMSLLHVRDDHALMNPVIYSNSMALSAEQCSIVRSAAAYFWPKMYR